MSGIHECRMYESSIKDDDTKDGIVAQRRADEEQHHDLGGDMGNKTQERHAARLTSSTVCVGTSR